ncbi:MAG TPA: amidohydrolase family protein, partial [Acidimicrobiales bacterium]|nr:amidohydrolase family protein [Acidimicrobiales bacterium]
YLQEMDWHVDLASGEAGTFRPSGARKMGLLPSELFSRHFYGCFIDDVFGARHIEAVGVDNVMLETDFPHTDSSYPHSLERARENLAGYDETIRYKVMQGNARRVFDFEPARVEPAVAR